MTQDFQDMLYLLGWNYKSQLSGSDRNYNVEKIKELAVSQGVWTLVFPELEKYADVSMYLNDFMASVSLGLQRSMFHLQVISDMNAEGLKACLLKGMSVALAYPDSSCRISGDTDILIDPQQENEVIAFLEKRGYKVEPRVKNDHHFKAYHPVSGLLEGHVRLYSLTTEKVLLNNKLHIEEEWTTEQIEGIEVPVLGLDDGLIYLTMHYINHLVNEGGGVRQMLDLLLYTERYRDKLDFDRYQRFLKEYKYEKLIDVIKTIGARYWGFNYPIQHEELADKLLSDSEVGGIFGYNTDARGGFYAEFYALRSKSIIGGTASWVINNERGIKETLFPSQASLLTQKEYSYARHKILIPAAWVHRYCLLFIKKVVNRKKTGSAENKEKDNRIEMMKELSII